MPIPPQNARTPPKSSRRPQMSATPPMASKAPASFCRRSGSSGSIQCANSIPKIGIIVSAVGWQQSEPTDRDCNKNGHRDYEPNGNKRNRWQVAQTDFDREPGGTPNDAEGEPRHKNSPTDSLHRGDTRADSQSRKGRA